MNFKKYTVVAILESKPGKENELSDALKNVAKLSRLEKGNIDFRLHKDNNNQCKFILYENWYDNNAHELQLEKPYIIELANKLQTLLNVSPALYYAEEIELCD